MLQSVAEGLEGLVCLLEAWELKECVGDMMEPEIREGKSNNHTREWWEEKQTSNCWYHLNTGSQSDDAFKVKSPLLKRLSNKYQKSAGPPVHTF